MISKGLKWSAISAALMFLAIVWAASQMPAEGTWAIHFDLQGNPNGYGDRKMSIFALALTAVINLSVYGFLAFVAKVMAGNESFEQSEKAYLAVWIGVAVFLTFLVAGMAWLMVDLSKTGEAASDPMETANLFVRACMAAVGCLCVVMGNYMPKTRQNAAFGLRTNWSLKSEKSWTKSNRFAGRLFLFGGLVIIATSLFGSGPSAVAAVLFITLGTAVAGSYVSWRVWRDEQNGN